MKTSELVRMLAADRTAASPPGRGLATALAPAFVLALALFLFLAGWREDLPAALGTPRFLFKLLLNVAVALAAGGLLLRLARPVGGGGGWRLALLVLPVLLAGAVALELLLVPPSQWWEAARGTNATWCLRLIPALSAAPLAASIWVLRQAAPSRPAMAGLAAGLMSAGIGGMLYATHCPDDSPLFVALWYGIATAIVAAAGALAGSRLLRW